MKDEHPPILWEPSRQRIEHSRMQDFMASLRAAQLADCHNYAQLHHWSVSDRPAFWGHFFDFAQIIHSRKADSIHKPGPEMWKDRWFPGCRLNYAENLLRFRDEHTALHFLDEAGNEQRLTYSQLYAEVSRVAAWLTAQGIRAGDCIAGFAANRSETVVAMLACTALGAIWSSCSPDFGVNGILDRFSQIKPRVLFAVSSHLYAGKLNRHLGTVAELAEKLPSLQHIVLLPELYEVQEQPDDLKERLHDWEDLHGGAPLRFHQADFNDPLFIMYSSGTTGVPKCIVHGVGGTLLQHRKEHMLHVDLGREDVLFYFTTCGWMMWNWLVSGLASGATVVLYDGSPFHPQADQLFSLVDRTGISVMGVSAKYLSAAEKAGLLPRDSHQLRQLRTVLSTGSPLSPGGFDYVYRDVKADLALQSISGGTDILSCFVLGAPLLPVYRGEIQCAGLGMDVAVYDEQGQAIIDQQGELVCRQSFPSMPIGFWNDVDDRKYRAAYFERFPGNWTHGDYARQTSRGTFIISGRSDTVLNPGGVRIGTAEIYRQVESLPQVLESVVVGQQWQDDVRVLLFVRLAEGVSLDEPLRNSIRQTIRRGASPRHVPALIFQVDDIPRTLSGKIAEVAVRDLVNGRPVVNADALANPQSLQQYRDLHLQLG